MNKKTIQDTNENKQPSIAKVDKPLLQNSKKYREIVHNLPHNNILIANFDKYQDVFDYIKNQGAKSIRTITFGLCAKFPDIEQNKLSINCENVLTEMVKKFWGIKTDIQLLSILEKVKLVNPLKIFSKTTSDNAERNREITEMFSISNNIPNRNMINAVRHNKEYKVDNKDQKKEKKKKLKIKTKINTKSEKETKEDKPKEKSVVENELIKMHKHSYLSNIIFMKYIMLFYDVEKQSVADIETLFTYNYYMEHLKKGDEITHTQLINGAKKAIYHQKNKRKQEIQTDLDNIKVLHESLKAKFEDVNDPLIIRIKSAFSNDPVFKYAKSPVDLFRRDLMKLGIDFDYSFSEKYYDENLIPETKTKYELRFIQIKLIHQYREILRKKYNDVKKHYEKNNVKYQHKLVRLDKNLPESLRKARLSNIPNDKPEEIKKNNIKKDKEEVKEDNGNRMDLEEEKRDDDSAPKENKGKKGKKLRKGLSENENVNANISYKRNKGNK